MTNTAEIINLNERRVVKADTDDGWYKLSTTLGAALCKLKTSDYESRVINFVMLKTFGFKKSFDWIAASQFEEGTNIPSQKISYIKRQLIDRKILVTEGKKIGVNTVVSEWKDKPKKAPSTKKRVTLKRAVFNPIQFSYNPIQGKKTPQTGLYNKKDNTTKEIKEYVEKLDAHAEEKAIIDYLNLQTGKRFKTIKTNLSLITTLLKNKYTVDEIKTVIDKKTSEWLNDPKMDEYLRPATLFRASNFDGYLNAKEKSAPSFKREVPTELNHNSTDWVDLIGDML